jgi:predicted DNA-binding transcriptional regulator
MVDHSLKIFLALLVLALVLPGCVGIITSATVGSSVIDRYEKHQLQKRIEELEKKHLTRRKNDDSSYATGGD